MKLAYAVASPETADADMLALRGPLADSFALLARHGYAGVDLMIRDPARLDARGLAGLAREHGLTIASLSTGQACKEDRLSLAALDDHERARAIDRGKAIIDLAAALGAQVNIGTLRGQLGRGPAREPARAAAVLGLSMLAAHAGACGVQLAIEPQSRGLIDWVNTVTEANALIDNLGDVGILLDVYHAALEESSVFAALVRAAPRLSMVQVSDSNRLPPGGGHLPLGDVVRTLHALGFDGFVAVEALQRPTPAEAVAAAARHLLPFVAETT